MNARLSGTEPDAQLAVVVLVHELPRRLKPNVSQTAMPFPTEQTFIARAEQLLGRKLPTAYVQRVLRSNGGSIEAEEDEWVLHPVFDDSDRQRLKRTFNDLVRETASARTSRGFPPDAVAIASDGSGDYLVVLPGARDDELSERVHIWEHETGELREICAKSR